VKCTTLRDRSPFRADPADNDKGGEAAKAALALKARFA